jgi:hypothetical protein
MSHSYVRMAADPDQIIAAMPDGPPRQKFTEKIIEEL